MGWFFYFSVAGFSGTMPLVKGGFDQKKPITNEKYTVFILATSY